MLSTVLDLARFGQAHLAPGFLSEETLELLFTSQKTAGGTETGVGVGWRLARDAWGRRVVHHAGSMSGARSVLVLYPDDGVVVALLANVALNPLAAEATAQILADPFLYRLSNKRSATRIFLVGTYEYKLDETKEVGQIEFVEGGSGSAGTMTTPSSMSARAQRFGIPAGEHIEIESLRVDESEALLVLATPLGLLGIRAMFGEDEFEGDIVALNSAALAGHLHARRLRPPKPVPATDLYQMRTRSSGGM